MTEAIATRSTATIRPKKFNFVEGWLCMMFVLLSFLVESVEAQRHEDDPGYTRGRTVLTILYLCVLGLCFVVPVFYYFRLHCCDDRHDHHHHSHHLDGSGIIDINDAVDGGFTSALEQSEQLREETRAVRKKYIEERRARILQLLAPVRLILREEHFPHKKKSYMRDSSTKSDASRASRVSKAFPTEEFKAALEVVEQESNSDKDNKNNVDNSSTDDIEQGINPTTKVTSAAATIASTITTTLPRIASLASLKSIASMASMASELDGSARDTYIEIPAPGLLHCHNPGGANAGNTLCQPQKELRMAPGMCSICLEAYVVGSDIVWSSNSACDHVFHESCIEQWLMKQREGPLCPCCRRDFIVDPYDVEDDDQYDIQKYHTYDSSSPVVPEETASSFLHTDSSSQFYNASSADIRDTQEVESVVHNDDVGINLTEL